MKTKPLCLSKPATGTHQLRSGALFGRGAHLRNASLHLCFDVALFSSSKTDSREALGKKSLSIPLCIHLLIQCIYREMRPVPGTGHRDEQNGQNVCTHGAYLVALFTKNKKQRRSQVAASTTESTAEGEADRTEDGTLDSVVRETPAGG